LNDIFGMWRRRSALCLCGIGVLEPEKEEHPTTPQIVEVHQRQLGSVALFSLVAGAISRMLVDNRPDRFPHARP